MLTAEIDTRYLEFMMNGLKNALIGQGGDISTIVVDESKLMAKDISSRVGPLDMSKTRKRIRESVDSKFVALGENDSSFFFDNLRNNEDRNGVKWYRADSRFLYGVADDADMRKADGQTLASIYFQSKNIKGKSRIVSDFKSHRPSGQMKAVYTKVVTTKSGRNKAVRVVMEGIGKLKASWFATAKKIDPSLVGPQFIEKHIHGGQSSRSVTDLTSADAGANCSVTFGSKALGNKRFARLVQFSTKVRSEKVAAKLKLVLSGYSQDVRNDIKIQKHARKNHES